MSAEAVKLKKNNGKWLILLIFIVSCAAILPLSWNAIQAQRAQQKTMKALKKSIAKITLALKTEGCAGSVVAPADELLAQARNVETVFPRLIQAPGDFAKLTGALIHSSEVFSAQAKIADCQTLSLRLPELKKSCDACHEIFHPQPERKVE